MMRRIAAVLAIFLAPLLRAQELFPISDPVFHAADASVATGDDSAHYMFWFGMMRLAPDGTPIDPALEHVFEGRTEAAAAGLGMVAFVQEVSGGHLLAGVTPEREVLWTRIVRHGPVVFDGSAFVHLTRGPAGILMTRYDAAGNELLRREIVMRAPADYAAARAGDGIVLVWQARSDVYATFVDRAGNASPHRLIGPNALAWDLQVSSNGNDAVAVWDDGPVRAARFDARGLTHGPVALATAGAKPAVLWDGRIYRVAWEAAAAVETVELGAGLTIAGRATILPGERPSGWGASEAPAMSVAGGRVVVTRHGAVASVAAGEPMRKATQRQLVVRTHGVTIETDASWAGDRYAVVWSTTRGEIFLRFLSTSGARLGEAIPVGRADLPGAEYVLRVAAVDGVALVVWSETERGPLKGRRFAFDGTAIDAEAFLLRGTSADVASDGRELRIVATDGCDLIAYSLAARGPWIDLPTTIAQCRLRGLPAYLTRPSIVWDGGEYGVLYDQAEQRPGYGNYKPRPFFVRVARNGEATNAHELAREYATNDNESWARLGSAEGRYVAVWRGSTGGAVVPRGDEDARTVLPPRPDLVFDFFWTGNVYVLVSEDNLSLVDAWGMPAGELESAPYRVAGGAGSGQGSALLLVSDPRNRRDLFGTILTTTGPRRRPSRK